MIEEIPAKCREKITMSMLILLHPSILLKGGYIVHATPAPVSIIILIIKNHRLKGKNSKWKTV